MIYMYIAPKVTRHIVEHVTMLDNSKMLLIGTAVHTQTTYGT